MHTHRHWHTRTLSQSAQAASKFFRATTATRLRLRLRLALIDRSPRNSFSNWARSAERQQLCAAQSSVAPAETALPTAKAAPHSAAAATATRHPNESKPSEWAPALTLSLSRLLSLSLTAPFCAARFKTAFHSGTHETGMRRRLQLSPSGLPGLQRCLG